MCVGCLSFGKSVYMTPWDENALFLNSVCSVADCIILLKKDTSTSQHCCHKECRLPLTQCLGATCQIHVHTNDRIQCFQQNMLRASHSLHRLVVVPQCSEHHTLSTGWSSSHNDLGASLLRVKGAHVHGRSRNVKENGTHQSR